ncbi:MAG TPA: hypothetical protein DIC35_01635 [Candidatus Moranbacteria bacterium]|nr:hypothetical protein [Candidatus Moranbacteria bacterium]
MPKIVWPTKWEKLLLNKKIVISGEEYSNLEKVLVKGNPDYLAAGRGFWGWIIKFFFWREGVVLHVTGLPKVKYVLGFECVGGESMYFSKTRMLEDGPFMMRIGPGEVNFFILGNDKISLHEVGRTSIKTPTEKLINWGINWSKLDLY